MISSGGTHCVDQGAFRNMCRGGRIFAPTKIWRRWHKRVNMNQKRYAIVSAFATFAIPSLVQARDHRIESVPKFPHVISDSAERLEKTSAALKALKQIGAAPDANKAKESHLIRPGKGKMRNRRYINRKGPFLCMVQKRSKARNEFTSSIFL